MKKNKYILCGLLTLTGLVTFFNNLTRKTIDIESEETKHATVDPQDSFVTAKIESIASKVEMEKYSFHSQCNCSRSAPNLSTLEKSYLASVISAAKSSDTPWTFPDGTYVGHSTCNRYTSALGSGQKVLSYTYYTPWNTSGNRIRADNKPNDQSSERYQEVLQPSATTIKELYPGWRMRIYHNVTYSDDSAVWKKFCTLYCENDHVDFCDVRDLPDIGDLNEKFPIGRFWRFQALGDPTVKIFGSRDVDSWIIPRERSAVFDWENSGDQFHIMRDGPFHVAIILAGLWGAKNYDNFQKALEVRHRLLDVPLDQSKMYDQDTLASRVWPAVRNHSTIHDSYNCAKGEKMGIMKPFPNKRQGFLFCGRGPSNVNAMNILIKTKCPLMCRPKENWEYC